MALMDEEVSTYSKVRVVKSKDFYAATPQVLDEVASKLLQYGEKFRLWLFTGALGVGKTTLITSLCQKLGTKEVITSPTFSIFHLYNTSPRPIAHIDLYRLQRTQDIHLLDLEEYIYNEQNYCFVEWSDKFLSFFSPPYVLIQASILEQETRKFSCVVYE